ncbi:MAG: response regulator [Symploca sp. SIO2C1]|nr:response regulator [Symploca sp. SIO2C1]
MISTQSNSPLLSVGNFTGSRRAKFFTTLQQLRFNGQLLLKDSHNTQWIFYLNRGDITYATGGNTPVRRWARNLATYSPQLPPYLPNLQKEVSSIDTAVFTTCWEYELLCLWVEQQKITLGQATKTIEAIIIEVLFDVAQAGDVTYQIKQDNSLSQQLILLDSQQAVGEAQKLWEVWQNAKLANSSPNSVPIIKQPEQLQARTSAQVYQTLTRILNGQRTLRELAGQMKRDVLPVTRSLLPYIQLGLVELVTIADLEAPFCPSVAQQQPTTTVNKELLIACVDDDMWVCKTMQKLLTAAGHQFIWINDGLRALATILARKPDLIFLDLVMPNTNGYEICSKLRKIPSFRNTPIIILTGNDGVVDQVRARLFGASDFISKPIDAETVLNVINKQIEEGNISD